MPIRHATTTGRGGNNCAWADGSPARSDDSCTQAKAEGEAVGQSLHGDSSRLFGRKSSGSWWGSTRDCSAASELVFVDDHGRCARDAVLIERGCAVQFSVLARIHCLPLLLFLPTASLLVPRDIRFDRAVPHSQHTTVRLRSNTVRDGAGSHSSSLSAYSASVSRPLLSTAFF